MALHSTALRAGLVLLGIMSVICIHELGHFTFAQLCGVGTPEFGLGIGPTFFEKDFGSTRLTINALPIGGYVEILGVRTPAKTLETISFITKPLWKKLLILLGGIIFNLLFFFAFYVFVKRRKTYEPVVQITPAQEPGIIGPLGIMRLAFESLNRGWLDYVWFLAILSLNLAIFNLLPLPILDGGHIIITVFEHLAGLTLSEDLYDTIMTITMIIIAALFVLTTSTDLSKFLKSKKM